MFNYLSKDTLKHYLEELKLSLKSIYKFYQKFININDEKIIELENSKLLNKITTVMFLQNYKDRSLYFHHKMNLCINVRKYLKFVIEDNDIKENIILDGYSLIDHICKNPFCNKDIEYYNNFAERLTKSLILNYDKNMKKTSLFKYIISHIFEYMSLLSDVKVNNECYNLNNINLENIMKTVKKYM